MKLSKLFQTYALLTVHTYVYARVYKLIISIVSVTSSLLNLTVNAFRFFLFGGRMRKNANFDNYGALSFFLYDSLLKLFTAFYFLKKVLYSMIGSSLNSVESNRHFGFCGYTPICSVASSSSLSHLLKARFFCVAESCLTYDSDSFGIINSSISSRSLFGSIYAGLFPKGLHRTSHAVASSLPWYLIFFSSSNLRFFFYVFPDCFIKLITLRMLQSRS